MRITDLLGMGKDLGARFTLVGLLPSWTLALFVLALLWSGAPADAPDLSAITDEAEALSASEGGLLLGLILIVSLIVQPLQLPLVRALEGYWGDSELARALARRKIDRHAAARERLQNLTKPRAERELSPEERSELEQAAAVLRRRYPPRDQLLPTRLGNALRATEARAGQRYGLDTITAWPRLYPLLPAEQRAALDAQRDQLDTAARFCAVFLLASVAAAGLLALHGAWLAVAVGTLALSYASYSAAISAALGYGEQVEAAFDLHRFALLEALHLPLPPNRQREREQNGRLSAFLLQGAPEDLTYQHPGQPLPAAPPKPALDDTS